MSYLAQKTFSARSVAWLRLNLFRNPIDGCITLFLMSGAVWLGVYLVEWGLVRGVWHASSMDECAAIIARAHGDGASGACWAVLVKWWELILFGLYPPEYFWRPTVAFILLLVALVPLLFRSLPRKLLLISAIYPIVAYYLIWGGAGLEPVRSVQFGGLLLTTVITMTGAVLALFFGISLGICGQFAILPVRIFCRGTIFVFRSVPVMVLLFAGVILRAYMLPPGVSFDLILWFSILLALPTSAAIASGLHDEFRRLPRGQYDAGHALGLSHTRVFWLIIIPQCIRRAAPKTIMALAELFQNTTLIIVVGFLDPVSLSNVIRAEEDWNGSSIELYVGIIFLFWIVSFAISSQARRWDRKLKAEQCEQPIGLYSVSRI